MNGSLLGLLTAAGSLTVGGATSRSVARHAEQHPDAQERPSSNTSRRTTAVAAVMVNTVSVVWLTVAGMWVTAAVVGLFGLAVWLVDVRWQVLPDVLTVPAWITALTVGVVHWDLLASLVGFLAGVTGWLLMLIKHHLSRGASGGGDVLWVAALATAVATDATATVGAFRASITLDWVLATLTVPLVTMQGLLLAALLWLPFVMLFGVPSETSETEAGESGLLRQQYPFGPGLTVGFTVWAVAVAHGVWGLFSPAPYL